MEISKKDLKKQAHEKINNEEWPDNIKDKIYKIIDKIINNNNNEIVTPKDLEILNKKIKNDVILELSFITQDIEQYIDKIPQLNIPYINDKFNYYHRL